MSSFNELEEYPSLAKLFDEQLEIYSNIENSSYPSNSNDYQIQVADCISKFQELTQHISEIGIFSANERFSELTTSSIKFLLLPVLLGSLTLKQIGSLSRDDILKIAAIYFKDFLNRCKEYELMNIKNFNEENIENIASETNDVSYNEVDGPRKGIPTPKELQEMATQRAEKIKRYKEIKSTAEKLKELKITLENPNCDEDVIRDYYTTMINHFICKSLDELDAIAIEQNMLCHRKTINKNKDDIDMKSQKPSSLKPFLITKDAAQKKIFGVGYPSLPVMSIDEFYDQRSKEEWFIAKSEAILSENSDSTKKKKEKQDPDNESDDAIERLRQRDEWKDDHRMGWGNTYNRS